MATVTAPMPMEHWSPSDYVVNTLDAINTVGQRIASDESDSAAEARDKDISVQVASAILPTALLGKTGKLAGKLVRSGKAFKSLEQTIGESNRAIQAMKRNMRRASKQALPKAAYDDMGDIASIKSDYTYDARGLDATYNYRPEFDQAYLDSDPRVREYLNDFESASWN